MCESVARAARTLVGKEEVDDRSVGAFEDDADVGLLIWPTRDAVLAAPVALVADLGLRLDLDVGRVRLDVHVRRRLALALARAHKLLAWRRRLLLARCCSG